MEISNFAKGYVHAIWGITDTPETIKAGLSASETAWGKCKELRFIQD